MNSTLENCSKVSAVRKNPCLKSTINKLYEQRYETGDIKFIIESEEIPAHRCVLAALSPKYKAQFYGAMAEENPINVKDVSPAAFKEFLQFFYSDEVTLTIQNIEDVLNLAKQSLVDELVTECTNFLFDMIGLDKLLWFYRLALDYEIKPLEEFSVEQIGANIKNVFKTSDFLSCEHEMLCQILDFNSLNCNETDIFDASIAWARAKCEQDGIDGRNAANLRTALGDSILKIRFCSMTIDEFAAIDEKFVGLLSTQESSEVYRTIALKRNVSQSSIFGDKNRIPRETLKLFLEISVCTGSPIKIINPIDSNMMAFLCDTAILLRGFVACNRIVHDINVVVLISGRSQCVQHTKDISALDDLTKITFNDPVPLNANEWCHLQISSKTFRQCSAFHLMKSAVQNGVTFKFSPVHQVNLITRLLFTAIDESKK